MRGLSNLFTPQTMGIVCTRKVLLALDDSARRLVWPLAQPRCRILEICVLHEIVRLVLR